MFRRSEQKMMRWGWGLLVLVASLAQAQTDVLVSRFDAARTGQNLTETTLTTLNVNAASFGKLYAYPIDGQAYAQPLLKAQLSIPNRGTFNTVFVATEHGSVYALDADSATPIWYRSFINPASGLTTRTTNPSLEDIAPEVSITSTPVIDPASGTLYVVAETVQSGGTAYYWLHALDITSGQDKVAPVKVQASVGSGQSPLTVDAATSQQRPGLLLVNGVVYVAIGSSGDSFPWVGWLLAYDGTTLNQLAVFCSSPGGAQGAGLWSSGEAPPVDSSGNIYISTGNGYFSTSGSWGDSFVKLSSSALSVLDYFTPFNQSALASADLDLASAGIVVLPDAAGSAAHPHLLIGSGKDGEVYLVDRDNMGHFNGSYSTPNSNIVQWLPGQVGTAPITPTNPTLPYVANSYTTPAYWQNRVYFCGVKDSCKLFSLSNAQLSTTPVSKTNAVFAYPGAQPVISAASASATSAILWAVESDSTHNLSVLHAYDATNLANEFYNSSQAANGRDTGGVAQRFAVPVVANGKVFVDTANELDVYGLLAGAPVALAAPTYSPAPGSYTSTQSVTLSAAAGATIYFTLDGSLPTLSSSVYTGPISVSSTTTVRAMAVKSGSLSSPAANATYTISAAPAQIKYVQGNYATPQSTLSSVTVKYTGAQQQGDLNVIVVGWNDSTATVKSVTDSAGNVYSLAVGPTTLSGFLTQAIYYSSNIVGAAANANTVTVTFNSAAAYPDIRIVEYSGVASAAPVDGAAAASGNSAAANSGPVATGSANDLLLAADITVTYTTLGSGYTQRILTSPDGDMVEDRIVAATGTYSGTNGISPAGGWVEQLVAFKAGTSSGGGTPTPTAPGGLAASAAGTTGINLSWQPASESGGSISQYLIERCQGSGCTAFSQIAAVTAPTTTFADSGLNGSTTYSYRVRAKDGAGNTGPYSNSATATTGAATPSAPGTLSAGAAGATQVNLTWGAASETGGTISQYLIERCQGAGCSSFTQVASVTTLSFSDTGLSGSSSYSYRVRAKDSVGTTGPYSNVATAVTTAPNITAPGSLSASAVSASQINLTWTAASESGGSISQYRIERCQGSGCSAFTQVATATGTNFNDAGLSAGTTYGYRVRAADAGGNTGPYSNTATATTSASAPAIAFVQQAYATPQSPQSTVSVVLKGAQAAGDLNVVVIGWNDTTSTIGTVTDSAGNTYRLAVGPTIVSGTITQAIYYAANIAARATNTVTVSFSAAAAYPDVRILEYSGIDPNNPLDVTAAGSGNSTLSSSGAATTTYANDLVLGANVVFTTTTGPGAGFTSRVITNPDSDIVEDRIVTATGSYTATAPLTPAGDWVMQLAAFRRHP
ncbi:MAG: fibronectin type III domain-containing protein [Gammaproteobacteria bacterium]|nr:fibronectin type III domain-containing protein [Gammaproteobacteria bacterium]